MQRPVELADRRRWLGVQAEGEGAGTVFRRVQKIVQFGQIRSIQMLLDNPPSPGIGAGIAQRTEDAAERRRFIGAADQGELDRIQLDRCRPRQIGLTVNEPTDRLRATRIEPVFAGGDHRVLAGQLHVYVTL